MIRKILLILVILPFASYSQNCSCEDNFKWLKETFEKNDAGFQYAIEQKGLTEYQKHSELFANKVKSITDKNECAAALNEWLQFFRKGHFGVTVNSPVNTAGPNTTIPVKWEEIDISEDKFKSYMSKIKEPGFEGIWYSNPYTIGIIKKNNDYIGFIIDAPGTNWKKGQIKLRIKADPSGTGYNSEYYMKDFSRQESKNIERLGSNFLKVGPFSMKRLKPDFEDTPEMKMYVELLSTSVPFLKKISKNTLLLRIPSFDGSSRKLIDSILTVNHKEITSTENLIIDIRNNGGGNDSSYSELFRYLYTNPIRSIGVEFLSTPLNNKRLEGYLSIPDLSEKNRIDITADLAKLNANLGKFVNLESPEIVYTREEDTIYEYPKNVGIIINENDGSTSEQFLLDSKQSRKVKLFGTTTMGVLDIANMYFIDFPCKDFGLGYCLSKSMRIPDMAIDSKGIQPDYYIDKSITGAKWVEYVDGILNTKK